MMAKDAPRPDAPDSPVKMAQQTRGLATQLLSEEEVLAIISQVPQMPDGALLELIYTCSQELKERKTFKTFVYSENNSTPAPVKFPEGPGPIKGTFVRLPAAKAQTGKKGGWRIVLASADPGHKPLALEIIDKVVIGRNSDEARVDIDLTQFEGQHLGVSRRHAMLIPGPDGLALSDVGSSNGTFHNDERIRLGGPARLENGDTLKFGRLPVKIWILGGPLDAVVEKDNKPAD